MPGRVRSATAIQRLESPTLPTKRGCESLALNDAARVHRSSLGRQLYLSFQVDVVDESTSRMHQHVHARVGFGSLRERPEQRRSCIVGSSHAKPFCVTRPTVWSFPSAVDDNSKLGPSTQTRRSNACPRKAVGMAQMHMGGQKTSLRPGPRRLLSIVLLEMPLPQRIVLGVISTGSSSMYSSGTAQVQHLTRRLQRITLLSLPDAACSSASFRDRYSRRDRYFRGNALRRSDPSYTCSGSDEPAMLQPAGARRKTPPSFGPVSIETIPPLMRSGICCQRSG